LIVGGGVGALEAMLALRDLAEERVEVTLLCPQSEFRYRPTSVAVPVR
jgi:NADH dehydrogenase FAD-containing subunit